MATLSSLAERVRVELGDIPKSFVEQFMADGTTNRFRLHYAPLDGEGIVVLKNNVDISSSCSVEESTGVMVLDEVPDDGDVLLVNGIYYRYFTAQEMQQIVSTALLEHAGSRTDSSGRKITLETLPAIEEHPVVLYASTLALYTLATDASFDIDILAPDGVTIPRSQRYRQLMEMIETRKQQYKELCMLLGIGLYSIEVFNFRRISKRTNRYVPVYKPQEVDDRSYPQRVDIPISNYGDKPAPWPTEAGELIAYQRRAYSQALTFTGNWAGKDFTAKILTQRGSLYVAQNFTLSVTTTGTANITAATRTASSANIVFTANAHGYAIGDVVVVTDVSDELDGSYTITAVSTNTFTVVGDETTALSLTGLEGRVEISEDKSYTFTLSLNKDQTARIAQRTYWSLSTVDYFTGESIEIKGGNFFTERVSTAVL